MKKLLIVFIALVTAQVAFADNSNAANIKIRINGATSDNRYFLCLPNVGCLSIYGASKGKVFPIYRSVQMSSMYVVDADHNFQMSAQGLPSSCNGTVDTNQTITISGNIAAGSNGTTHINQLRCSIS